jgi:hypothetical protein
VDGEGNVFIRPGPSTGSFSFLATALRGQYHSLFAELDPTSGKIRYRLNDGALSESDLSGKTRFSSLSFVAENPPVGRTVDIDNVRAELRSPNLPGFVFDRTEGTLRAGSSSSIPLTIHTDMLTIGTHVGVLELHTNNGVRSSRIEVNVIDPLSADDPTDLPNRVELAQNFPNPFNPNTVIGFRLSVAGEANLRIYDLLGREVAVLVDGMQAAGAYTVTFDATTLASGVYVYTLRAGDRVVTKKMLLMK